jgi:hypothetical protein
MNSHYPGQGEGSRLAVPLFPLAARGSPLKCVNNAYGLHTSSSKEGGSMAALSLSAQLDSAQLNTPSASAPNDATPHWPGPRPSS